MDELIPIIDKVVNFGIGAVIVIGIFFFIVFGTAFAFIIKTAIKMDKTKTDGKADKNERRTNL